jgi:hypothetical protein
MLSTNNQPAFLLEELLLIGHLEDTEGIEVLAKHDYHRHLKTNERKLSGILDFGTRFLPPKGPKR